MFELTFDTDNDAFAAPNGQGEVKEILERLAERIYDGATSGEILDSNGANVGKWHLDLPESIQAVYDRYEASLPASVDLHYLGSADDALRDDQIAKILAGQADEVDDEIDEYNSDNSYNDAMRWLKEHLDEKDYGLLEENNRLDDLCLEIQERATQSYFDLLREATGDQLFLYRLNHDVPELGFDAEEDIEAAARDVARAIGLDPAGLEFSANYDALINLVTEGQGGGLYVIWHGDAQGVMSAAQFAHREDIRDAGTISWTDPYLLVFDQFNGSGHDVKVTGTITAKIEPNFRLDGTSSRDVTAIQGGTTWHDVAGLAFRAYATEPAITLNVCKHCHRSIRKGEDDVYIHVVTDYHQEDDKTVYAHSDGQRPCRVQAFDKATGRYTSTYIDDPSGNTAEPTQYA